MDHPDALLRLPHAICWIVLTWVATGSIVVPAAAASAAVAASSAAVAASSISSSIELERWSIGDKDGLMLDNDRITQVIGTNSLARRFIKFVNRHEKIYRSEEEVRYRFQTFVDNLGFIRDSNKRNLSYTLGVNQFADHSWEEFKQQFLMPKIASGCAASKGTNPIRKVANLPVQRDWRDHGVVSPVKNQGQCGSCWAFSTTGALESAHSIYTGQTVLLSEQQLVDCGSSFDERNLQGCNGGWPSSALEYVRYNGGLDTESSYPYRAKNGFCSYNSEATGAKVYDVLNITQGDEEELQQVVGLLQPVSVCFEVTNSFRFYKHGVYSSLECQVEKPEYLNHAVLAVGYNLQGENGIPYWIVKNSWGPNWGAGGYFNAEFGKNMCGIAYCATYPTLTATTGTGVASI